MNELVSKTVMAMERTWEAIRQEHPEIPTAVMVLASGIEGKRLVKWGHWAASSWLVEGSNEKVAEVLVAGELLAPTWPAASKGVDLGERLLGTLLHEAAHGLGHARGVKNTSRGGRYHNRRFAELAMELGLEVSRDAANGWSETALSETVRRRYTRQVRELRAVASGYRSVPAKATNGRACSRQKRPLFLCRCSPPRKLRMSPSVFALAPVLCAACDQQFARPEFEEGENAVVEPLDTSLSPM